MDWKRHWVAGSLGGKPGKVQDMIESGREQGNRKPASLSIPDFLMIIKIRGRLVNIC